MAPRLKPKNTPVTQNSNRPLRGKIIAFSGTFKGETRETLKGRVSYLGGQDTSGIQPKPTHVISTEDSRYKEIQPRLIKYALNQSIPIVRIEWLEMCGDTSDYEFPNTRETPKAGDAATKKGKNDRKGKGEKELPMTVFARKKLSPVRFGAEISDRTEHFSSEVTTQIPHAYLFGTVFLQTITNLEIIHQEGLRQFEHIVGKQCIDEFRSILKAFKVDMCAE